MKKQMEWLESPAWALAAWEAADDRRNLKIAVLAALLIHIGLVYVVIPDIGRTWQPNVAPPQEPPVIRMPVVEMKPLDPVELERHVRKVPVPDPTPEAVEAFVPIDMNESEPDLSDDWIVPESNLVPPVRKGPVDIHADGLVPPRYDLDALQASVVYPAAGMAARQEGYLVLEVVLKRDGTVGDIQVAGAGNGLDRFPWFVSAATRAVRRLNFEPGTLNDRPVDVRVYLTIHFRLSS